VRIRQRKATHPQVLGLERFGLRSIKALATLGSRRVTAGIYWSPPSAKDLLKLLPRERRHATSAAYWDGIDKIKEAAPEAKHTPGKRLTLFAKSLAALPRVKHLHFIIESIAGMKGRKERHPQTPRGFAVRVRLIKETAGQRRGIQFVNDKTVVLKARDESAARDKVVRHFSGPTWTRPYVEPTGDVVRWRLGEILEVQGASFDPLGDGVTHSWSTGGKRRMRTGSSWNP